MAFCLQLGAGQEQMLQPLAVSAREQLLARLRPGVTEADCGEVFPLACAMLVMEQLRVLEGADAVTAFTAGEVSIRCDGKKGETLERGALRLLSPWLANGSFAVMGVEG